MTTVLLRDETQRDHDGVRAVVAAAFGGEAEARLVEVLRGDGAAVVSLVAEDVGRIVGHVMLSRLIAPMPALALAPLAVAPDRQRKGVGSQLVGKALTVAADRGWSAVLVLGDPAYYGRFGFDAPSTRGFDCKYAGEHLMMRLLRPPVPMTGRIAYPAAFERLDD